MEIKDKKIKYEAIDYSGIVIGIAGLLAIGITGIISYKVFNKGLDEKAYIQELERLLTSEAITSGNIDFISEVNELLKTKHK